MTRFLQLCAVSFEMLQGARSTCAQWGGLLGNWEGMPPDRRTTPCVAPSLWAFECSVQTAICQALMSVFAQVELAATLIPPPTDRAATLGLRAHRQHACSWPSWDIREPWHDGLVEGTASGGVVVLEAVVAPCHGPGMPRKGFIIKP